MAPLSFRPAAAADREPTPDLRQPRFDAGTTPLLYFAEWPTNYGHTLANSAAWLHARLQLDPSLAARAALVLATPLGLALPRHWQALVGPLLPARPIQSFADFSARLPQPGDCPGSGSGCGGGVSAAAGNRSRCFEEMLVCRGSPMHEALNISQVRRRVCESLRERRQRTHFDAPTAEVPACLPFEPTVRPVLRSAPPPCRRPRGLWSSTPPCLHRPRPLPPAAARSTAACGSCCSPAPPSPPFGRREAPPCWGAAAQRVLVAASSRCRRFGVRWARQSMNSLRAQITPFPQQVLNLPDLLRRCNAWRHTDPASGRAFGAACTAYQPGADLPTNMAGGWGFAVPSKAASKRLPHASPPTCSVLLCSREER